jgi:hypothetical protein
MVFNATFNNISVISWWSVLLVQETGGPGENQYLIRMLGIINPNALVLMLGILNTNSLNT